MTLPFTATIFVLAAASGHAWAAPAAISSKSLTVQCAGSTAANPVARLSGKDARQQLLVTARESDGRERDLTREVQYASEPAGVVRIDGGGWLTPLINGQAVVTASAAGGSSCALTVVVERVEWAPPVNFPNQVVPIFTKTGCNAGGCHGKASGQNGFKLSLLGFEPSEDYEHLVKEARGRRLFVAAPEQSLLLLKARAALPHGGGKRLEAGSRDYELMVRWINQGMPYGTANDPVLTRIEVMPAQRVMRFAAEQQLVVTAHYSDGSVEDVTRSALYEANEKELAQTEEHGLVKFYRQPGDVAVMVRYQAKVAVFRASIPLGAPIAELPAANNFVDDLVFGKLKQMGIPPSPLCDDVTFLRRASLDITGRLPDRAETQRFLADPARSKRAALIERLLARPEYADYFANKWSALLRNRRNAPAQTRGAYVFHAWVRDRLIENQPYDQFVRDILAASGDVAFNPPVAWYRQAKDTTTQLEDTAQLFLGTRLQCAQCHHHPFEKWSQQDYFSFSAFFTQVGRKPGSQPGEEMIFHKRGIATATNKKTKQPAKPAGLGSATVDIAPEDDPRQALVDWMVKKDNPFFARSLVNRYWKHFFNRGLVDPEDDLRETNPPTNPELLEALARHFVDSGFDLKALVRTLCQSAVYQFSAAPNEFNRGDKQHFSRYYPKRLTAEVLLDAINDLTGSQNNFEGMPAGIRAVQLPDNSFNAASYFLTVFGRPDMASSCECERSQDASLAQSLHLLNSKEVQDKLTADTGRAALGAADPSRTDEQKLRELYLLALAREPSAKEISIAQDYLTKKHTKRQAYEDLIWALINTKEFLFNH